MWHFLPMLSLAIMLSLTIILSLDKDIMIWRIFKSCIMEVLNRVQELKGIWSINSMSCQYTDLSTISQSYHEGVLQRLHASKLDPTGNDQDCLGMTPLHILTCLYIIWRCTVYRWEVPHNLITEDRGHFLYCMHFGGLHQLRLYNIYLKVINYSILAIYSTGPT